MRTTLLFLCLVISSVPLFSQTTPDQWKARIVKTPGALGITAADAQECTISSSYTDASSGIEYAYLQQTYQQLRVFNNIITVAYKDGKLVHSSGRFINHIRELNLSAAPAVEANAALATSARHLNLRAPVPQQPKQNRFQAEHKLVFAPAGIAKRDIETELLWVQDDAGSVHLAWNVNIDVAGSEEWWNVRVDARSGEVVNKDSWTVHEAAYDPACREENSRIERQVMQANPFAGQAFSQSLRNSATLWSPPNVENASYLVVPFPYESRNFGPVAVDNNPWLKTGANNPATSYGWHFDGTTNYLITRGNNVYAYDDTAMRNVPGKSATSTTLAPNLTFAYSPDFSKQPVDSINQGFNLTNLFYWNNIVHDVTYQYGFNESAGNFQTNNLGRGGSGNDHVLAEAQDGSGYDNANFSTSPDGSSGRMQMYLWAKEVPLKVTAPSSITGSYTAVESNVSLNNKLWKKGSLTGQVVIYNDSTGTQLGCDSSKLPVNSVAGKIALMYRGGTNCNFSTKFRTAQKAGAIGLIVVNNVSGAPITMGATPADNAIVIPGFMISQEDGAKIVAEISNGVNISINPDILLDGDIDNGVITHEYGHGVSNRLTGGRLNASCLGNAEQGGEGWSDYLALMITTDWSNAKLTDGPKPRPMATYANGQNATGGGLRRFPYSTDLLIDTLTYANVASNTEVHAIGEVWCSALWDMTWNIIQHEGSITPDIYTSTGNGGNIISLKLVMEGMKLQPCRPGFLDARNAILAADSILYNNRHKCDIWNAFARRGMGFSALQGLSTSASDQTPAFDVPSGILLTKSAAPSSVSLNQQITTNLTLTCQCAVPANGFTVSDTIPAGFRYVSSTQGAVEGNVVKFSPISFNNPLESRTLGVTLVANGAACPMVKSVNDNRDTDSTGGFANARISGNSNWVSSTNRTYSGARAWYAADASAASNFTLTSAPFAVSSLSVLSFWHYFVTENGLDGGKVEISSNNGATWTDARPLFLQNGYNTQLNTGAPEPNTFAFSGTSYATSSSNGGQFIQSLVNLSGYNGQTIQVRLRFLTNANNASGQSYDGWYVDDISVTNGCGGISKIALNNTTNRTDSLYLPVFITPVQAPLPLTLVSFLARQTGSEVALQWQTSTELNVQDYTIERSADGRNWAPLGSVRATNNNTAFYSYTDQQPLPGKTNYYRIRMTDKDGQYTYTIIRVITLAESGIASMSPNPAREGTTVYFAGKVIGAELLLTDLTGRVLQRHIVADNAVSYRLPTAGLPAGTYLVKMQLSTGMVTKKLVVGQ
ncbi:MAG: M36 family metallopeptidase [Williamsia sp.]|nr:M36 family metallopeptidase [Williamsia sp.]